MLAQIQSEFPEDVRLVYRHFPLISIHDKAALASQAADAAGKQGQFWAMHQLLYERQQEWADLSEGQFLNWLIDQAEALGLDADQFATDLTSPELASLAQAAWDKGVELGLPGTPFLVLNGGIWPNNLPMAAENITAIIKLSLLEKRQFTACPPMSIDRTKQYFATVTTEKGEFTIQLFADKAPLAVNNFVFLARNGWFDGVTFHRVIPGFVAQAGDPTGTGLGGPGYAFKNEIVPGLKFDKAGMVGMANSGTDTNGSQFFITYAPTPRLDGEYTIFGQVIGGMDVVESLAARDPAAAGNLPPGTLILKVTIVEK